MIKHKKLFTSICIHTKDHYLILTRSHIQLHPDTDPGLQAFQRNHGKHAEAD